MAIGTKELGSVELDGFENERLVDELRKAKELIQSVMEALRAERERQEALARAQAAEAMYAGFAQHAGVFSVWWAFSGLADAIDGLKEPPPRDLADQADVSLASLIARMPRTRTDYNTPMKPGSSSPLVHTRVMLSGSYSTT